MRICMVSRKVNLGGGIARYVYELCRHFRALGHEVVLYVSDYDAPRIEGLEVRYVPMIRGSFFERMKMHAWAKLLQVSTFSVASLLMVPAGRFDVVHVQGDSLVMPGVRTAHSCHLHWISMARRSESSLAGKLMKSLLNPLHMLVSFIELKDYRNSSRVIAVSENTAREVASSYRIGRSKIEVVPNGVDTELFSPSNRDRWRGPVRERHGIGDDDTVLIFVGAEFRRKGLGALIEAVGEWEQAAGDGGKLVLMVVGGDRAAPWEETARRAGIRSRIVFTGHVDHVERYFAAADIFLLPSTYEPFGLVLTEAMASGLPVVTTKSVGASSIIEDGVDGFVIGGYDVAGEMAKAIELLAGDRDKARSTGMAGRRAVEGLTWASIAERTLGIYEAVAGGRSGRP